MKKTLVYICLAYLISWLIWLPLYSNALGFSSFSPLPYQHALGGFGPLLSAFICKGLFEGKKGLTALLRNLIKVKYVLYFLIALLSPFVLLYFSMLAGHMASGSEMNINALFQSKEFTELTFPVFFLYNLLFFGFGEETGWRGFLLPALLKRFNLFQATLILTIIWALWHWPLFLYRPGYTSMDIGGITGWVLSLLTGSILLSWLYVSSAKSILICAIFHSTIDVAFTSNACNSNVTGYLGFLITMWGIVMLLLYRKHFFNSGLTTPFNDSSNH